MKKITILKKRSLFSERRFLNILFYFCGKIAEDTCSCCHRKRSLTVTAAKNLLISALFVFTILTGRTTRIEVAPTILVQNSTLATFTFKPGQHRTSFLSVNFVPTGESGNREHWPISLTFQFNLHMVKWTIMPINEIKGDFIRRLSSEHTHAADRLLFTDHFSNC